MIYPFSSPELHLPYVFQKTHRENARWSWSRENAADEKRRPACARSFPWMFDGTVGPMGRNPRNDGVLMGKMTIILIIQIFKASPSRVRWRPSGKRGKQVVFGRQRGSLFNGRTMKFMKHADWKPEHWGLFSNYVDGKIDFGTYADGIYGIFIKYRLPSFAQV